MAVTVHGHTHFSVHLALMVIVVREFGDDSQPTNEQNEGHCYDPRKQHIGLTNYAEHGSTGHSKIDVDYFNMLIFLSIFNIQGKWISLRCKANEVRKEFLFRVST